MNKLVKHKELEEELNRLYSKICCVKQELEQCSVVEGCFSSKYTGPGTHALMYDGTDFLFGDIVAAQAYPTVDTFADLPLANSVSPPDNIYLVLNTTGTWFINRKERGLYSSDGISWSRLGDVQSIFIDDTFQIKDNVDPSKVLQFNVDLLSAPSLKYFQNGTGTVAELKDIPSISIGGNTLGTATILQTGTVYLHGGSNITLSQSGNTIQIIGNSTATDYISSGQSSLFQQSSLMTNYLGTGYTTHTHSDYLQSSLFSQFLTTQLAQAFSGSNNSSTFQTLSFGNLNGLSQYISNGSLVGSYTVPSTTEFVNSSNTTLFQQTSAMSNYQLIADNTLSLGVTYTSHTHSQYINNSQSSLFQATSDNSLSLGTTYTTHTHTYLGTDQSSLYRFTSDNSQLQYTSGMSNYQLTANNSLSLDTGYTTHTHSQYLNTNQSSLFELSSHTSVFLTTESNQIASFTSGSLTFESLKFTNSNGFSFNSSTQGIYGSYTVPSDYVSSNQSSLFQHTSATSAITSNALNTSQSSLFRHTSADSQLQFTSAMSNYQTTGAYLTTAALSGDSSKYAGINNAITNGLMTVNTSGISLDLSNHLTTAMVSNASTQFVQANADFNGTNISGTIASNGISLSVNPGDGYNILGVNGNATSLSTTYYLSDANNVSFGLNAGTITASVSFNQTAFVFSNSNNISFGTNGSTITASVNLIDIGVSTGGNTLGTTGTQEGGKYVFVGGNNITLSQSLNAGSGTLSIIGKTDVLGTATAQSNATWTVNTNGISFDGRNYAGIGTSATNASITLNSNGLAINIATNTTGSKEYLMPFGGQVVQAIVNSVLSFRYFKLYSPLSFSRVDIPINVSVASTSFPNTANIVWTSGAAIYSLNGSTLNPIVGATGNTTHTWASNNNYSSILGGRYASFPIATVLNPGEYWLGIQLSTTNNSSIGTATTLLGNTISIIAGSMILTAQNYADFGATTGVSTEGLIRLQGLASLNLTATSQTYQQSQITVSGTGGYRGNILAILRNY